uniref:Uncharacterized protein n=1 Tax=Arundo donax TaxID=35708 RepID=A0A0A9A1B3_ARUDO
MRKDAEETKFCHARRSPRRDWRQIRENL